MLHIVYRINWKCNNGSASAKEMVTKFSGSELHTDAPGFRVNTRHLVNNYSDVIYCPRSPVTSLQIKVAFPVHHIPAKALCLVNNPNCTRITKCAANGLYVLREQLEKFTQGE